MEPLLDHNPSEIGHKVFHALKGIRCGSIEFIIHDSRIVQIERREKVRFDVEGNGRR